MLASAVALGCGGARYRASVNAASVRLEEARIAGAADFAPYEYYTAKELLQRAEVGGGGSDGVQNAIAAQQYANEAIQRARAARPSTR